MVVCHTCQDHNMLQDSCPPWSNSWHSYCIHSPLPRGGLLPLLPTRISWSCLQSHRRTCKLELFNWLASVWHARSHPSLYMWKSQRKVFNVARASQCPNCDLKFKQHKQPTCVSMATHILTPHTVMGCFIGRDMDRHYRWHLLPLLMCRLPLH